MIYLSKLSFFYNMNIQDSAITSQTFSLSCLTWVTQSKAKNQLAVLFEREKEKIGQYPPCKGAALQGFSCE